jgi:hypothetical protein
MGCAGENIMIRAQKHDISLCIESPSLVVGITLVN